MAAWRVPGANARSVAMQLTHVAYGGCWKCRHAWQRCSASAPRLAASQNGFVHSFGTGIGLVTWLQSLIVVVLLACAGYYPAVAPDQHPPASPPRTCRYHTEVVEFACASRQPLAQAGDHDCSR